MRDFCCCNVKLISENEIINSYGGNIIYRDTYGCEEHKKVFYIDINDYTCEEEFIEETDETEINSILKRY